MHAVSMLGDSKKAAPVFTNNPTGRLFDQSGGIDWFNTIV